MFEWIKRTLGGILVNSLWKDYLKDGGRLVVTDADGQEYEWVQSIGDWEPITIESV